MEKIRNTPFEVRCIRRTGAWSCRAYVKRRETDKRSQSATRDARKRRQHIRKALPIQPSQLKVILLHDTSECRTTGDLETAHDIYYNSCSIDTFPNQSNSDGSGHLWFCTRNVSWEKYYFELRWLNGKAFRMCCRLFLHLSLLIARLSVSLF